MKALLVIDMLNDFLEPGAPLEVPGGRDIIPNIKREIARARSEGIPIIYVNDAHSKEDSEFKVWPRHAVKGSAGASVVTELAPEKGDIVIFKTSYSGFFNTNLEDELHRLRIYSVVITGVVTNICVLYTAVDALMLGLAVEVPDDCAAALTAEDHKFALRQINEILKPKQA